MSLLPRKRFGQHFLRDESVIQHIIAALHLRTEDDYIEIGPGQGALTLPVLKQIKKLIAIELDRDIIPELKKKSASLGELIIYQADVLTVDFTQFKKNHALHVFGNLPYNISTPVLFHLLNYIDLITDITVMLQKEMAERVTAKMGNSHYGRLSVMLQYQCQTELLFNVPNRAFYPVPQVASSMIRLKPHASISHPIKDKVLFTNLVKQAFSQRRKTLRNSLKNIVKDTTWEKLNIDPTLRAENLSVDEFVTLSNVLEKEKLV